MTECRSVPTARAALQMRLNRDLVEADLPNMTAFAVLVSLAFAALTALLILGVMATRVEDTQRFVKLIVDTRRIRRHFAAPLEAAEKEKAARATGGKKPSADEIWPEPL